MIGRIRNAIRFSRRRKEMGTEFEAAYAEVRRWRPKKAFRQREWMRAADALDALLPNLLRAATVEELDRKSAAIHQIVTRCKAQVETESQAVATIDAAGRRADALRQRAASLQGSAFKLAENRHHAIKDECNQARRSKDARDEEAAVKRIAGKLVAFESSIMLAEQVTAAMPVLEARIAAIKPEEIWLDTGAKETYDDILATFAETQRDMKRGDYDKAAQRVREIDILEGNLRDRGNRRAVWALQEITMWLTSPSVAEAFPQLAQFPQAALRPADIESLYALRTEIERFVALRANRQRERNIPSRDVTTGRKLAASHPLKMPFEVSANPVELEEFLRCVKSAGR